MSKEVLIIEDDPDIRALISLHLEDIPVQTQQAADGNEGLKLAIQNSFDLLILDVMLPGISGIDILKELRSKHIQTPVLMLTAKSEEIDIILGLELGADDYLTKPFSVKELQARAKALLRRTATTNAENAEVNAQTLKFEELEVNYHKACVYLKNNRVELTSLEYKLIETLSRHPGRSFSRKELLSQVWGYDFDGYEHTVNSHINRLRSKIEPDPDKPKFILTAWGKGYRFNDEPS